MRLINRKGERDEETSWGKGAEGSAESYMPGVGLHSEGVWRFRIV
jgi:hypothetical protein